MAGRDARPRMSSILRAFGVDATVTAPNDTPIDTTGVWVPLDSVKVPAESQWGREEELRCLAFDVDEVPTMPRGSKTRKKESSKQAIAGTMVSQFRKARFPLRMRTT